MLTKIPRALILLAIAVVVRSPSASSAAVADAPASRWGVSENDTLRDTVTGLEWTRSDNGHDIDWPAAKRLCQQRSGNWRLPSTKELIALKGAAHTPGVACGPSRCAVPGSFRLTRDWFWSGDSVGPDGSDGIELAWGVLLINGTATKAVKVAGMGSRALCVHQTAPSAPFPSPAMSSSAPVPIDASHTAVIFSWTHRGFSHPLARLEQVTGTLHWNRGDLRQSSVEVSLPLEGLRTGDTGLDRRLRGKDFFEATTYPTITYRSTAVVPQPGTDNVLVVGDLTVHGVTQPVTLRAKINRIDDDPNEIPALGFDADASFRRSDFGLSRYVPMVGDEITVHITLEAHAP